MEFNLNRAPDFVFVGTIVPPSCDLIPLLTLHIHYLPLGGLLCLVNHPYPAEQQKTVSPSFLRNTVCLINVQKLKTDLPPLQILQNNDEQNKQQEYYDPVLGVTLHLR